VGSIWPVPCPVSDWCVAIAIEMKMKATIVNSRHNSYLRGSSVLITCLWKYAKHYFHFYWETRTRLQGEQTGKQRYYKGICQGTLHVCLYLKILKQTHTHTHTNICIYNIATWPRPITENTMVISCCRKTWTALIRALDSLWGCDLAIRDNCLSSSAVQSLEPSALKEKFT